MNNLTYKLCTYLILALSLVAVNVQASEAKSEKAMTKKSLVISKAWIRLMPPIATSTAAYFILENHSDRDIEVLNVSTTIAKKSTLHDMVMENDMATMVAIDELKNGETVTALMQSHKDNPYSQETEEKVMQHQHQH